jgi:hypothetical protein
MHTKVNLTKRGGNVEKKMELVLQVETDFTSSYVK